MLGRRLLTLEEMKDNFSNRKIFRLDIPSRQQMINNVTDKIDTAGLVLGLVFTALGAAAALFYFVRFIHFAWYY